MTLHWTDLALVAVIAVAASGATYLLALAKLRRVLAENQREMDRRLAALTEAIAMDVPESDDTTRTEALAGAEMEPEMSGGPEALPVAHSVSVSGEPAAQEDAEVSTEIKAAIAAAAIAALGNHARVVSARRVPSSDVVSPWTQQGRMIVQSSHNLRTRG